MRYINPGFKDWINFINSSNSISNVTDTSKSKVGIAFCNTAYNNYTQFDFPSSSEIYCRFDFYYTNDSLYFGEAGYSASYNIWNGFVLNLGSNYASVIKFVQSKSSYLYSSTNAKLIGLKYDAINSALFHLKWADSENGFMELQINDYMCNRVESADLTPRVSKANLLFQNNKIPISNIIISDEPISIKEKVVAVPISNIATDMTYDSETGLYTASAVNQSLFANLDVSNLVANFGSDSKVTGVAVVGNPAYRTAEGLSSFTALTKKNNTVTEHGAANVPADSSVIQATFKLSDTTIADLGNMQLGLKVGT